MEGWKVLHAFKSDMQKIIHEGSKPYTCLNEPERIASPLLSLKYVVTYQTKKEQSVYLDLNEESMLH